jgi:hypothetical protein
MVRTAAANAPNVARSLRCGDRQTTHTSQVVPATIATIITAGHKLRGFDATCSSLTGQRNETHSVLQGSNEANPGAFNRWTKNVGELSDGFKHPNDLAGHVVEAAEGRAVGVQAVRRVTLFLTWGKCIRFWGLPGLAVRVERGAEW